jgi:four helix bundle protein
MKRIWPTDCDTAGMTPAELKSRTKTFAVEVVKFARKLPTDTVTTVITRQLVGSGTSVGANYRSSCRAKSRADFVSKMTVAEEEADETQYWLEVLVESGMVTEPAVARLVDEAEQIVRILVASINTARGGSR